MNEDEIKFFTPTQQGELLSCNYRLSLHQALQDYLSDCRTKEGRPSDEKSDFEIEEDIEEAEKDGMPHPNFFDINIKHERIYKEFDYINKRIEERKKTRIKQAIRSHKRQVKEQENKLKEAKDKDKDEPFQGSIAGEKDSGANITSIKFDDDSDKDEREETKQSQLDDNPLVDSGSGQRFVEDLTKPEEKSQVVKQNPVMTPEEMNEKINEIDRKMQSRIKLSRKMILRDMDAKIMTSLSKAVKMKREKNSPLKTLTSSNSGFRIKKSVKSRHRKLKDRMSPQSKVFSNPGPYLKPNTVN